MGMFGDIAGGLFGAFSGNEQENAEYGRYQDFLGMGAKYRKMLADTYKPGGAAGYLSGEEVAGPTDQATNSLLRKLSVGGGNPFGSPGALMEAQKYTANSLADRLAAYRGQLAGFGNIGLTQAGNQSNRQLDAKKAEYDAYGNLISTGADTLGAFLATNPGGAGSGAPPGMGTGMTPGNVNYLGGWL